MRGEDWFMFVALFCKSLKEHGVFARIGLYRENIQCIMFYIFDSGGCQIIHELAANPAVWSIFQLMACHIFLVRTSQQVSWRP